MIRSKEAIQHNYEERILFDYYVRQPTIHSLSSVQCKQSHQLQKTNLDPTKLINPNYLNYIGIKFFTFCALNLCFVIAFPSFSNSSPSGIFVC